jgi:hypothetical protein
MFADLSFAVVLFLLILAPLWVMRRQRDQRRLEVMRAADAVQERREREDALQALLDPHPSDVTPPDHDGTNPGNEKFIN